MGFVILSAVWMVALVTAEVVALIVGMAGCVTGSIALYKAINALTRITQLETEQTETLVEVSTRTDELEEQLKSAYPTIDE